MDSALELRRQLLDVYSAVDRVRTGSLKHEIVPPDPDSRERTELGRRAIDMEASGVEVDEFGDVVEDVKLNSVFDVANLSITATGGRTNVRGPRPPLLGTLSPFIFVLPADKPLRPWPGFGWLFSADSLRKCSLKS